MEAVPQPRIDAAPADEPAPEPVAAPPASGGRRSLAVALLSGAAGAGLTLLATGRTWATGSAVLAQGSLPRSVTGSDVTGVPGALAVVGLAALVAVFAVRRAGRIAVAALLTLSGLGTAVAAVLGLSDTAALREKASTAVGVAGTDVHHVTYTLWPWVTAAGGALLLIAGLLALLRGRHWPAMSGKYERTPGGARGPRRAQPPADPDRPEEIWKSLDRGEDPTR
ncbi:TIGR02234 family membrane protein [Streptomyces natalensis]|uniref:Membrane protein n=1 Tax=Streptomyces natalensis ATCC 27448 TaxID=1240678 RepID=A0A0D7CR09_9ACTN|nr:TIGR02234 family membrane protein [Streptomyces natalensis]KIZ18285.1 membrane protein [Streptomyces natalensis ATCC 27448]